MSNIQIKDVPDEVHEELRRRAAAARRTIRDYVLDLIERDLAIARNWEERLRSVEPVALPVDTAELVRSGRQDRDGELSARVAAEDRDEYR